MLNLLKKERALAMHPTAPIFLCLSAMLLIPHYPYYVVFFYMELAVFFTCLAGRENQDLLYTMLLPVRKRDVVRARFTLVALMQGAQLLVAVPFAVIRQGMPVGGNNTGMDANIAFFALALGMLGLFNLMFFTSYYGNVGKVGGAFIKASIGSFLYMGSMEACVHIVPFFRDYLDTPDPEYLGYKLLLLFGGFTLYALLTFWGFRLSVKRFERFDLSF